MKAPANLFSLLDPKCDPELLVRLCHFMANVVTTTCLRDIKPQDLPSEYKAASPETLYSAIYGFETSEMLINKFKNIAANVPHDDVLFQVNRILKKVR